MRGGLAALRFRGRPRSYDGVMFSSTQRSACRLPGSSALSAEFHDILNYLVIRLVAQMNAQ